jgi:two-component system phosphate regulon sensor histidine kinase PhoR
MKKLRLQLLLMIAAILAVASFQLFWLKQTYAREQKTLEVKTDQVFRNTIQELQVTKLKLDNVPGDSTGLNKVKVFVNDSEHREIKVQMNAKQGVVSTINVIRRKMKDSLLNDLPLRKGMIIADERKEFDMAFDSTVRKLSGSDTLHKNHIFRILLGVDSLQDSIKITEINKALNRNLTQAQINIPFTITKTNNSIELPEQAINEVTVGFAHPVTYKLSLGSSFKYLLKQISLPILFSVFLLGLTCISFILLYRNLLRQRRLTEIKNEFIGNITHELKTPIATVSVAIEAMKNFNALQDPVRTQEYLDISANELQRLSLLVDKVLSLSKYEKNEIEIRKEKFDLLSLVKNVIDSMKPLFEKQQAVPTLQTTGSGFMIFADERHISSVVYNLLDNALKYSKENSQIDIHLTAQDQYLELRVSDNGIGIPPEYTHKIFEQFFRVPNGDKHNIKGYGLGLSYVNYIVHAHHGFIEVESELGKGSTFIVKIPVGEI